MNLKQILAGLTALTVLASTSGISTIAAEKTPTAEEVKSEKTSGNSELLAAAVETNAELFYYSKVKNGDSYKIRITGFKPSVTEDMRPTTIVFPDFIEGYPVTYISGFAGNTNLTAVSLPTFLEEIGNSAFSGDTELTYVNMSPSVKKIGDNAFMNCSQMELSYFPVVTEGIGNEAFYNCSKITEANISGGIIGYDAFSGCTSLSDVSIGSNVTAIYTRAFFYCTGLENVSIPEGVTTFANSVFYGCSSLRSISLPNSLTQMGESCFRECTSLTSASLGKGLISVPYNTFYNCSSLKDVTISNNTEVLGSSVFMGCTSLTDINIPNSVVVIKYSCFNGCSNLQNVTFSSNLNTIEEYAFNECTSLKSAELPDSVSSIGKSAFKNCSSLESVHIPARLTTIQFETFRETGLKKIEIPSNINTIEWCAFCGCYNIEELTIPDNVTLSNWAFGDNKGLKRLTIGKNVKFAGAPFQQDYNLEYITSYSDATWSTLFNGYTRDYPKLKRIDFYNNSNYTTKDGVLYNKDMTQLLCVPPYLECEDNTFVIPDTVTYVGVNSFSNTHTVLNVVALDSDERALSYPYDTLTYGNPNGIEKFYYYNGKKPMLNADWTAVNLAAKKDKKIEQYTIQVIDSKTGNKYSNALVVTEDKKYAAITDEEGMAVFEVDKNDEEFWNSVHLFNVVCSLGTDDNTESEELTSVQSEDADKITDIQQLLDEYENLGDASASKTVGSAALQPAANNVNTILVTYDLVNTIYYNKHNVCDIGNHNIIPKVTNDYFLVDEVLDPSYSPEGDTLTISFKNEVRNNGWLYSIAITDVEYVQSDGSVKIGDLIFVDETEVGGANYLKFDSFTTLITKKIGKNTRIGSSSRIKVMIRQKDQELDKKNIYYLNRGVAVCRDMSSSFGIFSADNLSKSFGSFTKGHAFFDIPNVKISGTADIAKKTASLEIKYGLSLSDVSKKNGSNDTKPKEKLTREEKKQKLAQKEMDKLYKDYPEAKNCYNADGTPVTTFAQFAASPDTRKLLSDGINKFNAYSLFDVGQELEKAPVKPYFDLYAAGKVTGKFDYSKVTVNGDLGLGFDMGIKGKYKIPQLANLAYISASLGTSADLKIAIDEMTFSYNDTNNDIQFENMFMPPQSSATFGLKAQIAGGVGVGEIVDANLAANLKGATTYRVNDKKLTDATVSGDITLSAKLLAWKNSYELAGFKATVIDSNGNPDDYIEYELFGEKHNNRESGEIEELNSSMLAETINNTASASDFTLIPRRDYAVTNDLSDENLGATTDDTSASTEIVAQNVFELSDPKLISVGGNDYIFRFIDDTSRSTANGSTLVYSKRVDGAWSSPVIISDNGTADFDMSICSDGNSIYIAWCDIGSVISDNSLYTDAIKASTISVAKLDTSSDEVTVIGNVSVSEQSNLSPSISVRNGSGIVAWISNANFDPLTVKGNDEIYYSEISGNSVSSPKKYVSSGTDKIVGVVEAGFINSQLSIVYSTMEPNGKAETSELYGSAYNTAPVQLTSNDVVDSNPQFEKLGGQDTLFWYYENTVVYTSELGGEVKYALGGINSDKFDVVSSDDTTKIAWCDQSEDNIDVLKMVTYENGEFTNNYVGNELGCNPSVFSAAIDSENYLQVAYTYQNAAQYDLAITKEINNSAANIVYATVGSEYHSGDESVPLTLTIYNSGNTNLGNATINIADSTGNVVASYPLDLNLEIGICKDYTLDAELPDVVGLTTYTVSIDGIDTDTATFTIGFASVSLDGEVYEAGGQRYANVICHNNSSVATGGVLMTYIDDKMVSVTTISNIDYSANSLSQFNLTELAGGNEFTKVVFKLEGTRETDYSGVTELCYEFENVDTTLAAPDITEVTDSGIITWTPSEYATGYIVYRSETQDGEKVAIGEVDADVFEFIDNNVEEGKEYYYYVEAVNSEIGETAMSDGVHVVISFDVVAKIIAEGTNVVITTDAIEDAISYTWQVNTGEGWNSLTVPDNTTDTINLPSVETSQDGYCYRCIIKNQDNKSVISTVTKLEVILAENVTEDMVTNMTVEDCIGFVNCFSKKASQNNNKPYTLTEAQLKAIEIVLNEDRKVKVN